MRSNIVVSLVAASLSTPTLADEAPGFVNAQGAYVECVLRAFADLDDACEDLYSVANSIRRQCIAEQRNVISSAVPHFRAQSADVARAVPKARKHLRNLNRGVLRLIRDVRSRQGCPES